MPQDTPELDSAPQQPELTLVTSESSTYEVDLDGRRIRRIHETAEHRPFRDTDEDGWAAFEHVLVTPDGLLMIVWETWGFSVRRTQTTTVTDVSGPPLPTSWIPDQQVV